MRKLFFFALVSGLVLGCATSPPVRNPQFTGSSLPSSYRIEGVKPVKQDLRGSYWASIVMLCNFYDKPADQKAIMLGILLGVSVGSTDYYSNFLSANGFRIYEFYDESLSRVRMKYFISQGYPVIAEGQVETNIGSEIRRILLIGYNDSGGIFVINDPSVGETLEITYKEFEEFNETRYLPAKGHGIVIYPKK